jgi:uncharacterized phage protein (TIGR01671 family)
MREIEFRGKRVDIGHKWCYGNIQERCGHVAIYEKTHFSDTPKGYYVGHSVIPETVGQYTGLTDKNGAKIFEGDIVETKLTSTDDPRLVSSLGIKNREVIEYWKGKFKTKTANLSDDDYSFEIIGNIHDNPELLGRK